MYKCLSKINNNGDAGQLVVAMSKLMKNTIRGRRPSIKEVRTKSRKIDPPLFALAQSPLSVRKHQTFRKIPSFCTKKCGYLNLKNPLVRTVQPPLLRTSFTDSQTQANKSNFQMNAVLNR